MSQFKKIKNKIFVQRPNFKDNSGYFIDEHRSELSYILESNGISGLKLDNLTYQKKISNTTEYIEEIFIQKKDWEKFLNYFIEEKKQYENKNPVEDLHNEGDEEENIKLELKLVNDKIKELYKRFNVLQSYFADKQEAINKFYNAVSKVGTNKYKKIVLNYLKEEYGYDDLADELMSLIHLKKSQRDSQSQGLMNCPLEMIISKQKKE